MTGATVASIDLIQFAEAIKGKGVGTSSYGSATNVCGLQLCSEIPGGKAAWMEQQKMPTPVAPVRRIVVISRIENIVLVIKN